MYPDLTVDLLLADTNVALFIERIDLAIRLGLLTDSTLIAQQLMQTRYFVCTSPQHFKQWGHSKILSDIENHNGLLFPLVGFHSRWRFRAIDRQESELRTNERPW